MMKETLMALCAFTSIFISCNDAETSVENDGNPVVEETKTADEVVEAPAAIAPENAKLSVYKAPESARYSDAKLTLENQEIHDDGKMHFQFKAENYDLGAQTQDAEDRGCANSAKGQHIHYIMNNAPYKAHYTEEVAEEVPAGKNILLAFLSRSYHESIKNAQAAVIAEVYSGGSKEGPTVNLDEDPILFYSRPKGSYKSSDGNKILLDFYTKNVALSPDGYRVKASINGETWVINEWAAYFIEGLNPGTHTVQLELIDGAGKAVPGPFNNSGSREFTITAD